MSECVNNEESRSHLGTHAFITSRIDYCNSLLVGIPDVCVSQLQRIQNCTARLIYNTRKYDHIQPVLKRLHWLPVKQRITFKLLLITYKAVHGLAPQYMCELVQMKQFGRELRSTNQYLLQIPHTRLKTYGDVTLGLRNGTASQNISDWLLQLNISNPN